MLNKIEIRETIQKQRSLLSNSEVLFRSQKISNNVISNLLPKIKEIKNKKIALYLNINNEVDTSILLEHLFYIKHVNISLPKVNPLNNSMIFKQYKLGEELENNNKYKKILEPKSTNLTIDPEIVFTPLVACDKNGKRIGMGGGFYDKKIAQIKKKSQNITLIGLAYDFQILTNINSENFDQSLDFIVFEDGIIDCQKQYP